MQSLKDIGSYSTSRLIKLYALMKKTLPDTRFPYIVPHSKLKTLTISDRMRVMVYIPWNYQIFDPSGNYLERFELNNYDRITLERRSRYYDYKVYLDFNKIVEAYQNDYKSYYFAENIETTEYCDCLSIVARKGLLMDRNYTVMPLRLWKSQKEKDPEEYLMNNIINKLRYGDNHISGYIPYSLLGEYSWTVFHWYKKFDLPYITPSKEIRNLHVPKEGINDVMVFVKDHWRVCDNKGFQLFPYNGCYGKMNDEYPRCYAIPYWDFVKMASSSFKYTIIDRHTGETLDFMDNIYKIAVMAFKGRTTNKMRSMYITTTA